MYFTTFTLDVISYIPKQHIVLHRYAKLLDDLLRPNIYCIDVGIEYHMEGKLQQNN